MQPEMYSATNLNIRFLFFFSQHQQAFKTNHTLNIVKKRKTFSEIIYCEQGHLQIN